MTTSYPTFRRRVALRLCDAVLGLVVVCAFGACSAGDAPDAHIAHEFEAPNLASPATGLIGATDRGNVAGCGADLVAGSWSLGPIAGEEASASGLEPKGLLLCANQISKNQLLRELSVVEGFVLSGEQQLSEQFSGSMVGDALPSLLRQLLAMQPFSLVFEPIENAVRLARVSIEPPGGLPNRNPATAVAEESANRFNAELSSAEQTRWQNDYGSIASDLSDENELVKRTALEELVVEGEALSVLAQALATEASPDMRISLLEKLDESGSVVALLTMLQHLKDPDPAVVVASVQLINDWHDEEVVLRYVQPLLQHDDEVVRDAAADAIDRFR